MQRTELEGYSSGMGESDVFGIRSRLEKIMEDLRRSGDVKAVAIARRDGLIVAHNMSEEIDPKKVAAISATILGTSEIAISELKQGDFLQTLIEGSEGKLVSTGAGEEALIVAIVDGHANLGLVFMQMKRAARLVDQALREAAGAR